MNALKLDLLSLLTVIVAIGVFVTMALTDNNENQHSAKFKTGQYSQSYKQVKHNVSFEAIKAKPKARLDDSSPADRHTRL